MQTFFGRDNHGNLKRNPNPPVRPVKAKPLPPFTVSITTAGGVALDVKVIAADRLAALATARRRFPRCTVWGAK